MTAAVPWWGAAWRQFRLERRMFWRNPSAAFFGVLLPLGLLAIFGAVFAGQDEDLDVIVPGIAGMSVMSATFTPLCQQGTRLSVRLLAPPSWAPTMWQRATSPGSTMVGKQMTCSVGSEPLCTRSRVTRFAPVLVTV